MVKASMKKKVQIVDSLQQLDRRQHDQKRCVHVGEVCIREAFRFFECSLERFLPIIDGVVSALLSELVFLTLLLL